jgi:hypothetical protein
MIPGNRSPAGDIDHAVLAGLYPGGCLKSLE